MQHSIEYQTFLATRLKRAVIPYLICYFRTNRPHLPFFNLDTSDVHLEFLALDFSAFTKHDISSKTLITSNSPATLSSTQFSCIPSTLSPDSAHTRITLSTSCAAFCCRSANVAPYFLPYETFCLSHVAACVCTAGFFHSPLPLPCLYPSTFLMPHMYYYTSTCNCLASLSLIPCGHRIGDSEYPLLYYIRNYP